MVYILFDTEYFSWIKFDSTHSSFDDLDDLIQGGFATVLTSSILRREAQNRANDIARLAITELKKFQKELPRHYPYQPKDTTVEELSAYLYDCFVDLMRRLRAIELDIDSVPQTDVFEQYFATEPPFGTGNKRKEFPDAVNMASFRKHVTENNGTGIVVSGDPDLSNWADQHADDKMMCCMNLSSAIKLIYSWIPPDDINEGIDATTEAAANVVFDDNIDEITRYIEEKVAEAVNSRGYDYDDDFDFIPIDIDIHDIAAEAGTLERFFDEWHYEAPVSINATLTIEGEDYTYAIYDREDHKYYNVEHITRNRNCEANVTARIKLTIDVNDNSIGIDSFELLETGPIQFDDHDSEDLITIPLPE